MITDRPTQIGLHSRNEFTQSEDPFSEGSALIPGTQAALGEPGQVVEGSSHDLCPRSPTDFPPATGPTLP